MYTDDTIVEIVSCWGLKFNKTRPDLPIAGSPERTVYRIAIEDEDNGLWVLENPSADLRERKLTISKTLAFLRSKGLTSVHPYLSGIRAESVVRHGSRDWQVRPYVEGVPLPRPSYVLDRWRGRACADFLLDLRDKAHDIPFFDEESPFSITGFLSELLETMGRHDPETRKELELPLEYIEQEFVQVHDQFPIVFCHGDFHALNVIWAEDAIKSVIDWEFLGFKPEVYDMANMIGCVGFEDPAGLSKGFVIELTSKMTKADAISPLGWQYLVEWVVAIRFAWLSDWLRRRDREMIDLEVTYINMLVENREALKDSWRHAG
jgi:homoserine kinase type II